MLFLGLLIAAEVALFAGIIILREPKLLIPAVVLGLPIEYFQTQTLSTLGESGAAGAVRAMLNPGKAAMLATIVIAVVRERHRPWRLFPNSMTLLPLTALVAVFALGVAWSDSLKAPNSVLIMPMYLAFVFAAPSLIEDRRDLERIVGAFLLAAIALSALAVVQRVFNVFNWRDILIQSDDYSYRSNATFADPNHLARNLSLTLSLAAGLILTTGPRRTTVYLAMPALVIGGAGIVATASRSGWLMLMGCVALVILISPIARYTKVKLYTVAGVCGLILIGLLLAQGGADAERVRSLTSGVEVLGQREFLIKAGWAMFKDNPFVGVGSGNYQHALIVSYLDLIPTWARTTLSHTSLVSILAELGIVGISVFGLVFLRVGITVVRTYLATTVPYLRLLTGWIGAGIVGIVIQSQSEGRLIDDPYLWLLLALLVAIETGRGFAPRAQVAEAERQATGLSLSRPDTARQPTTQRRRREPVGATPAGD